MRTFRDKAGREWAVEATVDSLRRARDLAGFDLGKLDGALLSECAADPVRLVDTLYAVLKPDIEARKISPEEFGCSLGGQPLQDAWEALIEEVADFLPPRRGGPLRRRAQLARQPQDSQMQALEALISRMSGSGSTNSPEPSALTPAGSPSADSSSCPAPVGGTSGTGPQP